MSENDTKQDGVYSCSSCGANEYITRPECESGFLQDPTKKPVECANCGFMEGLEHD